MSPTVADGRPPAAVLAVLNPLMRILLRSRLGLLVPSLALLEFRGRRTGRRYQVPVGWHLLEDRRVVLTPARWSRNFAGGAAVTVHHAGRQRRLTGRLVEDPQAAATALEGLLAAGLPPGRVGLRVTGDGLPSRDQLASAGRCLVEFE